MSSPVETIVSPSLEVRSMSLTQIPQPITRINHSELAVRASNPCFIDTASRSDADVVFRTPTAR